MQTLTNANLVTSLSALLQVQLETVSMDFLKETVEYLRSTVRAEIADAVAQLGNNAIDVSGTGGSGVVKFNTSTAVAFVLAAYGVNVVKFGNRSITGRSGSVDFLDAIDCGKDVSVEGLESTFSATNILFLNAQLCYPTFRSVSEARKKLGRPSIFNFVGPLLNPASPEFRLLGISDERLHDSISDLLSEDASVTRAITVRSTSGVDEIVPNVSSIAKLVERGNVELINISEQCLVPVPSHNSFGSPQANAGIFQSIVDGNDTTSMHYHSVVLNAAIAFLACGAASTQQEGMRLASSVLSKGLVRLKLNQLRSVLS